MPSHHHGYQSKKPKNESGRVEVSIKSRTAKIPGDVRGLTRQIAGGMLILIVVALMTIVVCTIVY